MKTLAFGKGKMHNIVIFKGKSWVPLNDTDSNNEKVWNRVVGGGGGKGVGGKDNFFKTDQQILRTFPSPMT